MACAPFWLEHPAVLWEQASEFFPFTEKDQRCTANALNSLTRFGVYLGVLLAVIRINVAWLGISVALAAFAAAAWWYMDSHGATREGFDVPLVSGPDSAIPPRHPKLTDGPIVDALSVDGGYTPDIIGSSARTGPTAANPFMNVLIPEIGDNPYRPPATAAATVRAELDQYFETMFASDPGDVFGKTQNQRTWITQPSTTIPNDQGAFADWLFRVPGQTCKEGNQAACLYYSTGSDPYPWRSIA